MRQTDGDSVSSFLKQVNEAGDVRRGMGGWRSIVVGYKDMHIETWDGDET